MQPRADFRTRQIRGPLPREPGTPARCRTILGRRIRLKPGTDSPVHDRTKPNGQPPNVASERIIVKIAGIVFSISSNEALDTVELDAAYSDFLCTEKPEISVHARYGALPDLSLPNTDRIFESESLWSLYRVDRQHIFVLKWPNDDGRVYRLAVFDEDLREGKVFSRVPSPRGTRAGLLPNPLEYPLSEVLMICLLARRRGLMFHACGVVDAGRGYLFAGNSTHGKTTMARLWKDKALVVNDDRIVVRRRDGRFWMYGTPWHGDYDCVSPQGAPLERVFTLHPAPVNEARPLDGAAAVSMLLTRCFPPFWDAEGMRFTVDLCSELVRSVPCHALAFQPDAGAVDLVRSLE